MELAPLLIQAISCLPLDREEIRRGLATEDLLNFRSGMERRR
jgi:hypothetical protein